MPLCIFSQLDVKPDLYQLLISLLDLGLNVYETVLPTFKRLYNLCSISSYGISLLPISMPIYYILCIGPMQQHRLSC